MMIEKVIKNSILFSEQRYSEEIRAFLSTRAPIRVYPKEKCNGINRVFNRGHIFLEKKVKEAKKTIIFLHGLFGGIYNYIDVFQFFSQNYKVVMPYLPMYDSPIANSNIESLGKYLRRLILDCFKDDDIVLIGTSTGAGAALFCADLTNIKGVVLCGSIGLGHTPLKLEKGLPRNNYKYIKYYAQSLFYNPNIPSDEMIKDIFEAVQDNDIVIRVLRLAKSVINQKYDNVIEGIQKNTLLIWGEHDNITPIELAKEFNIKIKNSKLKIIPNCGHVTSQERPNLFIKHVESFLDNINY